MNPTWAKGYARKGAALHGQRHYVEAIETYENGLKIEDSPAIRKGLEEVKATKGTLRPRRLLLPPAPSSPFNAFAHILSFFFFFFCFSGYAAADECGDGADAMGLGNMFSDPGMFAKLAANPRTAKHLADVSFMQKVCTLRIFLHRRLYLHAYIVPFSSSSSSYSRILNWRKASSAAIRA